MYTVHNIRIEGRQIFLKNTYLKWTCKSIQLQEEAHDMHTGQNR